MESDPVRREFLKALVRLGLGTMLAHSLDSSPAVLAFSKKGSTDVRYSTNKTRGLIVLGMDGLDPRVCESMIKAHELPAFSRLAGEGTFSRLATTVPPQSPVAWSSMATSTNPDRHGIYDFLSRNPQNYLIELAILKFNPRNILGTGSSMFLPVRKGTAFWEEIAEHGIPATVLRWPLTFPPRESEAQVLAGLGVPDIAGGLGRYSFYSDSEKLLATGSKGNLKLVQFNKNKATTEVLGPKFSRLGRKVASTLSLELEVNSDQGKVVLNLDKDSDTISVGSFSKWFRLEFSQGFLSSVRGICRFYLGGLNPLRLYLTPLQVDPLEPIFPISTPAGLGKALAEEYGLFNTLGMPEDTNALVDDHLDEKGFLEQCDQIISEQEEMFFGQLDSFDGGLLASVFFSSDRIQHIFWATRDPKHPGYSTKYAKEFGSVIPDLYKRLDRIVERASKRAKESGSELLICSDHGFSSFRRGLHVNSWLAEAGFMGLKSKPLPGDTDGSPLFQNVDWSQTKAYSFGFNQIFLNIEGREGQGILGRSDVPEILDKIKRGLLGLQDNNGNQIVSRVFLANEIWPGIDNDQRPDLLIGYSPGYRTSWQTALGGAPGGPTVVDNLKKWSGDHLIDPAAVPGCLFTTFKHRFKNPSLLDIGPTTLSLLGVPIPEQFEGKALA
jgi:predicted AlkP superfamily phosphohydrolase/phosphomutase